MDTLERTFLALCQAAERSWNDLAEATTRVRNLLWAGMSSCGDPVGDPSHPRGRGRYHRRQEANARALMRLIQEGVAQGHRSCVMAWCMLVADAIGRFDSLDRYSWILRDVRLGGVPGHYHATLIEISRLLQGSPGDRVEVAYLLAEFVTADPLLLETVTRLYTTESPKITESPVAPPDKLCVSTTAMIEAVDQLRDLTHDQLTIAHLLAATWLDGPAALAVEVRIRSLS